MKFLLRWTSDQKNKGKNMFENIDHVAMGYCQYPCIVLGEVFLASKIQFRNQSLTLFFFIKETSVPHVVLMQISKITSSSSQAGYPPPSNSFDNLNFEYYLLQRNLIVIEGYCQLESNHLGIFDDVNFIQIQLQFIPSEKKLYLLDEMFQQSTPKNLKFFFGIR